MKLFNLNIITEEKLTALLNEAFDGGYKIAEESGYSLQELVDAKQRGYNEGKADGIKQAKKAFALALKQKQGE